MPQGLYRDESELQIPAQSADALGESEADPLEEGHDEDSFYRRSGHTSPALSSLPRVKIPQHASNIQGGNKHLPNKAINSDSYYDAMEGRSSDKIPAVATDPEQAQIPEGVNIDLFYNPRIAKMLGGTAQGSKGQDLKLKGTTGTPIEKTALADNKDQDTFKIRNSSQREPTSSESSLRSTSESPVYNTKEHQELRSSAHEISKRRMRCLSRSASIEAHGDFNIEY